MTYGDLHQHSLTCAEPDCTTIYRWRSERTSNRPDDVVRDWLTASGWSARGEQWLCPQHQAIGWA